MRLLFLVACVVALLAVVSAASVADRMRMRNAPKAAVKLPVAAKKVDPVAAKIATLSADRLHLPPYDPFGIHEEKRVADNQHRKDLTALAAENARRKACGKDKILESQMIAEKKRVATPVEKPTRFAQYPVVYNSKSAEGHKEYNNAAGTAVFQRRRRQHDIIRQRNSKTTGRTFTPGKPYVGKAIQDQTSVHVTPLEAIKALPSIPAPSPVDQVIEDPLDLL